MVGVASGICIFILANLHKFLKGGLIFFIFAPLCDLMYKPNFAKVVFQI